MITVSPRAATPVSGVPASAPSGRFWPMLIVALLLMNAAVVSVTVFFAVSDKSVVTEPSYYSKALNYNDTIRQRGINTRLGWYAEPSLRPARDGQSIELAVTLQDRLAEPLSGVALTAVAFASVRSGQRQTIALRPTAPGQYAAPINIDRSGVWCISLTATRGDTVFTSQSELFVPDIAR